MADQPPDYNFAAIRELLTNAFSAQELRRFLQERPDFLPVLTEFGPKYALADMVDEVIVYCEKRDLMDQLLGEVRAYNPRQYERFEPRLREGPAGAEADPKMQQARDLLEQGQAAQQDGDLERARDLWQQSYRLFEEARDPAGMAESLQFQGGQALEQGDLDRTLDVLQQSLELARQAEDRPGEALSLNLVGRAAQARGDYGAAETFYRQSRELYEAIGAASGVALNSLYLGQIAIHQGNYTWAEEELQRAIELDPDGAEAYAWLGWTYTRAGDYDQARRYLDQALERDPEDAWAYARRGDVYRLRGEASGAGEDLRAALADLDHAVELAPDDAWTLAARGETHRLLGEHEAASEDFMRAYQIDREDPWMVARRGENYRQMGNFESARRDFDFALHRDPDNPWTLARRGEAYRQMESYEAALADFNRALERNPNDPWALARRGETHRQMGDYQAALDDLGRAVELDPDDDWARERYESLQAFLDEARPVEGAPPDLSVSVSEGVPVSEKEQREAAPTDLAEVPEVGVPPSPLLAQAREAVQTGQFERAAELYWQAISPGGAIDSVSDLAGLAAELYDAAMQAQASGDLQQASSLYLACHNVYQQAQDREGMARSALALGQVERELGNLEEAEKHLQESLAHYRWLRDRSGVAQCELALGRVDLAAGDADQARRHLEQARRDFDGLDDREGQRQSLQALARLAGQQGDQSEALYYLDEGESLLKQEGDERQGADGLLDLGRVARDVGLLEQSEAFFAESLALWERLEGEQAGVAKAALLLGQVLLEEGRPNAALPHLERSHQIFQELGDQVGIARSLHAVGEVLLAQGDLDGAERVLQDSRDRFDRLGDDAGVVENLVSLGQVDLVRGDYDWALSSLLQALERDPENGKTHAQRAEVYLQMGDHDAALADFDRALELLPDDTGVLTGRAECYGRMGRTREAIADLDRLLELAPDDEWARERRQALVETVEEPGPEAVRQALQPSIEDIVDDLPTHESRAYPVRAPGDIQQIVIVHTATSPSLTPQRIAEYQVREQDRPGIPYHYFLSADGTIYQTNRLETETGGADPGQQERVLVCFAGDFAEAIPTVAQLQAGGQLCAWLLARFGLPTDRIVGLSELEETQSPGRQWLTGGRWKDLLLNEVNAVLERHDETRSLVVAPPEAPAEIEQPPIEEKVQPLPEPEAVVPSLTEAEEPAEGEEAMPAPSPEPDEEPVPGEEPQPGEEPGEEIEQPSVVAEEEPQPEPEPRAAPRMWIVVAKPEQFDWDRAFLAFTDDPDREPIHWTEVTQVASQNCLQQAREDDHVLAYNSVRKPYITGLGEIASDPYPYDDRHAIDITLKQQFPNGVLLDLLKERVPDLEKVTAPLLSFTEVKPAQWAVIRTLILDKNPDAGLEEVLPPAPPLAPEAVAPPEEADVAERGEAAEPAEPGEVAEGVLEDLPREVEKAPPTAAQGVPEEVEAAEPPSPEELEGAEETPTEELEAAVEGAPEEAGATEPPVPEEVEEVPPAAAEGAPEEREAPEESVPEELTHLEVDAAVPERVQVGQPFEMAVSVRHPGQPKLDLEDLDRVDSGDVYVDWPEAEPRVQLRLVVSAPACDLHGKDSETFRLPRTGTPPLFLFHLTPKVAGLIPIVVKVYQEDEWLGSTRVRTEAQQEEVGEVGTQVISEPVAPGVAQVVLLWQGHPNPPPKPPEADDWVHIEVEPATVTLTRGDRSRYRSPNLLDQDALEDEATMAPDEAGELLFRGIIHSEGSKPDFEDRPTYDGLTLALNGAKGPLRVILEVSADYANYTWEYLKDPKKAEPLSLREQAPFCRLYSSSEKKPVPANPIRILFAICNPRTLGKKEVDGKPVNEVAANLEPLNKDDRERKIIDQAMAELVDDGHGRCLATYHVLERGATGPVTLDAIRQELKRKRYHVLHLLAHGVFLEKRKKYALVMEDEAGDHAFVQADDFQEAMFDYDLRLVVLAACDSAKPGIGPALKALAPRLVEKGVPAVIAMQREMPIEDAQVFTQRFYGDLARTGRIDMALAATRHDLYIRDPRGDGWAIPVLLMSRHDGQLFLVDEVEASTLPRPGAGDLVVKDYEGLGAEDPSAGKLARAIEEQLRLYGRGGDATLSYAMRTVLAPHLAQHPPRPEPLTAGQKRENLDGLALRVAMDVGGLAAHVGKRLKLPPTTYAHIASALNAGKHIILIGPPGTGKTTLAQEVCRYAQSLDPPLTRDFVLTTATADWTTFDTVGGYVPTQEGALQFRPGIFLEAVASGYWLIIDEINRAEIDKAFGELFTLLSGQGVDLPYKVRGQAVSVLPPAEVDGQAERNPQGWIPKGVTSPYQYVMHPNWRIIGTMNVYDKSALFQMSFAFMRRFAFVDVDPPDDPTFFYLVDHWLQERGVPVAAPDEGKREGAAWAACNPVQRDFRRLLHRAMISEAVEEGEALTGKNPLMERRTLGPAIVQDMLDYIGNRYSSAADKEHLLPLLGEAFLLYAVPQLDALDYEGILDVYQHVKALFAAAPAEQRLILHRIEVLYPHITDWEPRGG